MKDTLRDKIAEIVDYCSESYYPEHEYGNTWADRNKEYLAEAVDQILSLIEEENELPRNLRLSYQIRITDLESQLKIVNDFAELMATLKSKGER